MFRVLLAMILCTGAMNAADIYVDAGSAGNDANPGTIGSPKKTLTAALTAAANGDTVILRGGNYAGNVEVSKDNITIQSVSGEWAVVSTSHTSSSNSQCVWITGASCTLKDLEISGGYYYCIKIEGTTGHVIEDCRVHGSGRDCFKLVPHSDNTTIRRCEVYDSGLRDSSNAEGIDNVNSDNMHVHDCYFHDIATNGVYAKGGAVGCLIERNLITDCGTGGIFLGFQTDSVYMNNAGFDNNPSYYENIDGTVRNNIVVNTVYAGIGLCSAQNPKVYNNTLINVATGGMSGLHFHPRDGDNDLNPPCTNVDIRNNLVYMNQGTRPLMNVRTGVNSSSQTYNTLDTSNFTMDFNFYYRSGGSVDFRNDQTGQTNLSFSAWATAMGTDANSYEQDPDVNLTSYHLNGSSPCINKGASISVSDDYDGNTRSGTLDVGADETGGTALQTPPAAGTIGTGNGAGPAPTPPNAPTALQVTATGALGADLSWTDNSSNETGFRIERKPAGGSYATITTTGSNTTTFGDSGLTNGQDYTYRVIAANTAGDSSPSNEVTITGTSTPTAPGAPTGCSATALGGLSIQVSWNDTSSNEDGFTLERKDSGGSFAVIATLTANATGHTDTGLVDGVTYTYRVMATNTVGNSAFSNEASATASQAAPVSGSGGGGGGGGCTAKEGECLAALWLLIAACTVFTTQERRRA
ncbi:MAG: right-handed parallel beta-helix repeat-containing protein [Planctomycetota bacterium]